MSERMPPAPGGPAPPDGSRPPAPDPAPPAPPHSQTPPAPPHGQAPPAPPHSQTPPAPPHGQAPPAPYTAPSAPQYGQALTAPPRAARSRLGLLALVLALVAGAAIPIVGAIAGGPIGHAVVEAQAGSGAYRGLPGLTALTPVRDWVLLGEIAFWAGTVLGICALVQGIVAVRRRAGRGAGIAAIVVAAAGPVLFGLCAGIGIVIGAADAAASL